MTMADVDGAAGFIAALTGEDGWLAQMFFQTFDDRPQKAPRMARTFVGTLRENAPELVRLNGEGACVAVAINKLRGRRRLLEEVVAVRALFIDCDGPRSRPLALPTSITVESHAGRHFYWLLEDLAHPAVFADAQRHLAAFYGSDAMVCDPTRVMRLPGFDHCKAARFRVRLVRADPAVRYSLAEILGAHPIDRRPDQGAPAHASEPQNEAIHAFRRWAATAPRSQGARNATAFAMAAEGLGSGYAPSIVAREVRDYCDRAGIPREADAVLRSAARHVRRRSRSSTVLPQR
jgi:hypothetical protein